jgi:hypothetical protein
MIESVKEKLPEERTSLEELTHVEQSLKNMFLWSLRVRSDLANKEKNEHPLDFMKEMIIEGIRSKRLEERWANLIRQDVRVVALMVRDEVHLREELYALIQDRINDFRGAQALCKAALLDLPSLREGGRLQMLEVLANDNITIAQSLAFDGWTKKLKLPEFVQRKR